MLPLGGELRPAFFRDPVVLTPAAVLGRGPLRRDKTLALEAVQQEYLRLAAALLAGTDPILVESLKDREIFDLLGWD